MGFLSDLWDLYKVMAGKKSLEEIEKETEAIQAETKFHQEELDRIYRQEEKLDRIRGKKVVSTKVVTCDRGSDGAIQALLLVFEDGTVIVRCKRSCDDCDYGDVSEECKPVNKPEALLRKERDIDITVWISKRENLVEVWKQVIYDRGDKSQTLSIKIPPKSAGRGKIIMKGMGKEGNPPGDLLVTVKTL